MFSQTYYATDHRAVPFQVTSGPPGEPEMPLSLDRFVFTHGLKRASEFGGSDE